MESIGYIKRTEKQWFIALIVMAACVLIGLLYSVTHKSEIVTKLINTFALLLTLAGLVQLEISGVFEKLAEIFSDDEKYPSGPPSYFCREIMVSPDDDLIEKVKEQCFINPKTGFLLIVIGTVIQLIAVWL